jgi:hypothetical protein
MWPDGAPKVRKLIAAVLGVSLGLVAISCVAFELAAARPPPARDGRSALAVRGSDLQSTLPPAVMARVARTWPRDPGSRPATVVGGAALGAWLWLRVTRRKASGPERQIIWCDACGPRGPPVTLPA